MATQRLVRRLPVGDRVVEAILDVVRTARPGEGDKEITQHIAWGPGPRAAQALMLASRARALVGGRLAPSLDDIKALAEPVLKHRMALTFAARAEGETVAGVIQRLVEKDWLTDGRCPSPRQAGERARCYAQPRRAVPGAASAQSCRSRQTGGCHGHAWRPWASPGRHR